MCLYHIWCYTIPNVHIHSTLQADTFFAFRLTYVNTNQYIAGSTVYCASRIRLKRIEIPWESLQQLKDQIYSCTSLTAALHRSCHPLLPPLYTFYVIVHLDMSKKGCATVKSFQAYIWTECTKTWSESHMRKTLKIVENGEMWIIWNSGQSRR